MDNGELLTTEGVDGGGEGGSGGGGDTSEAVFKELRVFRGISASAAVVERRLGKRFCSSRLASTIKSGRFGVYRDC
jgi:hypothetical protein